MLLKSLWFVALCLSSALVYSDQATSSLISVTINNQDQCSLMQTKIFKYELNNHYRININFDPATFECPWYQKGFLCGIQMAIADPFDALGLELCVDLQGVTATIPNSQFVVNASNEHGDIKQVFTSSLHLEDHPDNIRCGDVAGHSISLALRALSSVRMCPNILPTLVNHNTTLGTIISRPTIPQRTLHMRSCSLDSHGLLESSSILKFDMSRAAGSECGVTLSPLMVNRRLHTCFDLEYVSQEFSCGGRMVVMSNKEELLRMDMPSSRYRDGRAKCFEFNYKQNHGLNPQLLVISDSWGCEGKFALHLRFDDSYWGGGNSNHDDDPSRSVRNVYMAVFISVISVCVLIMGLTCLCCLRMRARRLRNAQAANRRAHAATNGGFNHSNPDHPQALWSSSTSSDQVFGLPSYEDVTGGSTSDIGKPPAYDTLFMEGIHPASPEPLSTAPSTEVTQEVETATSAPSGETPAEGVAPPAYTQASGVTPTAPPDYN